MTTETAATRRTTIYIDGLNLYYGALKGTPFKWLNIEKMFTKLRMHDDVRRIYYFTALVNGSAQIRQVSYLRALHTTPLVSVIEGRFKDKEVTCAVRRCTFKGRRSFLVPEEKRTDVNIGTIMLDDAYRDVTDRIVLVSGDSDLVSPLLLIKHRFPEIEIIVYVPAQHPVRGAAVELRGAADKHKMLPLDLLKKCQFPAELDDGRGGVIKKPDTW